MTIDWDSFTPLSALAGGILIGIAASMLVLLNGRIAGISGILGSLLGVRPGEIAWRAAFLAGILAAPLGYAAVAALPPLTIDAGYPTLVAAGLLVGVGTRYAGGCTSGHGVCGLARLSGRSMTATVTFLAVAIAVVFLTRHVF
jgi:uncharacterized protein